MILTRQDADGNKQLLLTILKNDQRVEEIVLVANDKGQFVKQTADGHVLAKAKFWRTAPSKSKTS